VDLAVSYRTPLFGGVLNIRGNATYVGKFEIVAPGSPPSIQQQAGNQSNQLFATPHWKANVTTNYTTGPFGLTLQARYVGPGRQDTNLSEVATATSQPDISPATNHVKGYVVFNLGGTIDVLPDRRAEFFWNVENLFNRDPLLVPSISTGIQTNGALYDVIGRYFRAGFRFKI
jgi:outer membrane receptor protein involved in Fe transport